MVTIFSAQRDANPQEQVRSSDLVTSTQPKRRRRRFYTDPRFFIGIVITVASVAGVWWVVEAASRTTSVLVTTTTLLPGEAVTAADVTVAEVAAGIDTARYLAPSALADGVTVSRVVGAGELLPAAATEAASAAGVTTVVVTSAVDVPSTLERGDTVELWQAAFIENGRFDTPVRMLDGAVVAEIRDDEAMLAAGGTSVELVIDRASVADVLAAVASGASLSVIPEGGD